jgi:hypothetical protein
MIKSRLRKIVIIAVLPSLLAGVLILSSSQFNPDPSGDAEFIARAQQKTAAGITVSASALGTHESRRSFGEDFGKYGIQPVWVSIKNETDDQLLLLSIAMDQNYYSPYEVSYRFHGAFSPAANRARDLFFLQRQMSNNLAPRSLTTGFMYGVADAGIKYAHILIARNSQIDAFDFALPVPGPAFVGTSVSAKSLYPGQKIEDLDLDTLRVKLAQYPCCTTNGDGTHDGDPLNLVVVESNRDSVIPFIAREWHLTQKLDANSILETVRAFVLRDEYLTSPISPLYVFGREQDLALQKARSTINERIHARLWLTPYTFQSRRVWIGQVSRDIGVRLTDETWNLTTHKIGPDVDFDRLYILQDLLMSGFVERYGYVTGVHAATESAPRANLTGDPYYTDGLRVVVFLSNQITTLTGAKRLPWESPPIQSQKAASFAWGKMH